MDYFRKQVFFRSAATKIVQSYLGSVRMEKSIEESARERRNYVEQARAAFGNQMQQPVMEQRQSQAGTEAENGSTFGIRCVIAILLFVCFVYCDQEKISFQGIGTQQVLEQMRWDPLPTEKLEEVFADISISSVQDGKQNDKQDGKQNDKQGDKQNDKQ